MTTGANEASAKRRVGTRARTTLPCCSNSLKPLMAYLRAVVPLLVTASLLSACSKPHEQRTIDMAPRERALDRVATSGVLRCGYIAWPLLLEIDPNTRAMSGLMHDITEEIGRRAKLQVSWVEEVHFGTISEGLRSGKIDAICSGVWVNTERSKQMQFSAPIAFNPATLFVSNRSPIRLYQEILGNRSLRMITIDGEASSLTKASLFPHHQEISLPKEADGPSLLLHLQMGKGDFTLTDEGSVQAFESSRPDALRKIHDFPNILFPIAYVVANGEHGLAHLLDVGVQELHLSGVTSALITKYDSTQRFIKTK